MEGSQLITGFTVNALYNFTLTFDWQIYFDTCSINTLQPSFCTALQ